MAVSEHRAHWRGWHVIARFTPMVILGLVFIAVGLAAAPHLGPVRYGPLFFWLGILLVGAAIIGMLFTKCPTCYSSSWVMCYMEPDVLPDHGVTEYYRDLAPPFEEIWPPAEPE
jgi:hypothetical protein